MRALPGIGWAVALSLAVASVTAAPTDSLAMDDSVKAETTAAVVPNPDAKARAKEFEFAVFKKHCTQCHVSVADPERPGKTRDEWYAIINLMEGHGLRISQEEADMIVDLLFSLRRGIEDTPG